jgi:hypothetical protein
VKELQLSIYKILKEANKWYREDYLKTGKITTYGIKGLTPTWTTVGDILTIRLEADHCNYCVITHQINPGELCLTHLTFHVAPEAVDEAEVYELMLIGIVRLYAQFKELNDAS